MTALPRPGERIAAVELGILDASLIERYARESGDDNPVHLAAEAAQAIGLPDRVAHGMLLMGMMTRLVAGWRSGAILEDYSCRFIRPVPVGTILIGDGRVAKVMTEGECPRVILQIVGRNAAGTIVALGEATMRLIA